MDAAIRAEGLSRRFADFAALAPLDLEVRSGEVPGYLVANGARKTTTIRLFGFLKPTSGRPEIAADIARDAVLYLQEAPGHPGLAALLETVGMHRLVVHQATGMIAARLDVTPSDALARLRAAAFESGRSIYDIAQDVVERRVRFGE